VEKTKVVFRVWKGSGFKGDVIALFPELDEGSGYCTSYEHVGQHSGADYRMMIRKTRPAAPFEIEPLKQELESIGYNLLIRSRR